MKRLLGSLLAAAAVLAPLRARAADVQSCINASEKGQRARGAGKLREARDLFQVCANDSCPAMIRKDCVQWQQELAAMIPTVVFGAKDKQGRDVFDVTVTMDGEVLQTKLDGKSIAVDPGAHTFKFEVPGSPAMTEKVLIKESEKSRIVNVTFGGDASGQTPSAGSATGARPDQPAPAREGGGHTVFPWIVFGVGGAAVIAGAVVLLTSPELPAGCDSGTKRCEPLEGDKPGDLEDRQSRAGQHDTQPVLGGIIMGAGGVVMLGGLLWHFLEPTGDAKSASVRVTPWTSTTSSGLSLSGRF